MFNIAAPFTPDLTGNAANSLLTGGAIGQCIMDTFQVTGSGGASPVICGANDGQHMIVDTDGAACVTAAFSFGIDTATRNYRIHAIQYDRLNEMGGPAGCLQFFTGEMGTVNTFNWIAAATSTHLVNQDYNVCVRRMQDRCTICWSPILSGANADAAAMPVVVLALGTFGLSNGAIAADAIPLAGSGDNCVAEDGAAADSNDYIIIPNGVATTLADAPADVGVAVVMAGVDKYCGRYLGANAATLDGTICSRVTPFKLSVFTDNSEAVMVAMGAVMAKANENSAGALGTPLGTMGFSLGFAQLMC